MESIPPSDETIATFWEWFGDVCDALARDSNSELLEELDRQLMLLGVAGWELGPGEAEPNALTVSPDGDPELLLVTRRIVSLAPPAPGWEFYSALRPRPLPLAFILGDSEADGVKVDARAWKYVLYEYPDGLCDIVVEQAGGVRESDRYTAAVVALDGLLGEEVRLSRIHEVEPTARLARNLRSRAMPLDALPRHLESLAPLKS